MTAEVALEASLSGDFSEALARSMCRMLNVSTERNSTDMSAAQAGVNSHLAYSASSEGHVSEACFGPVNKVTSLASIWLYLFGFKPGSSIPWEKA